MIYNDIRKLDALINDVCKTILIKSDTIDYTAIENYIKQLKSEEITIIKNSSNIDYRSVIREITQKQIYRYMSSFDKDSNYLTPFDFDQADNYKTYLKCFREHYNKVFEEEDYPLAFTYVFECIKEASENYRLFEAFSNTQKDLIVKNVQLQLNSFVTAATREATDDAQERITKGVKRNVATIKNDLNKEVSKTSVTILGIFSGIVLAFVAGLSYSASVLESASSTNFFKLLSVASLIGLVCYNLISLMFRFIIRIRESNSDSLKWNKRDKVVTVILSLLIVLMGALQYVPFLNEPLEVSVPASSVKAEIEVKNADEINTDKQVNNGDNIEPSVDKYSEVYIEEMG